MIKYRTSGWSWRIEQVEVQRETDKSVWVEFKNDYTGKTSVSRSDKNCAQQQFHDTWEAAHAYLLDKAERAAQSARVSLEHANGRLGNVKGMQKPAATSAEA